MDAAKARAAPPWQQSLEVMRAKTQGMEAQAAYRRTPIGMAQTREEESLRKRQHLAQEQTAQQKSIALHGKLGASMLSAATSAQKMAAAASPYITAISAAAAATTAFLTNAIAAASPSTYSTFTDSMTLAAASVGKYFIPAMDQASGTLQTFAAWMSQQRPEDAGKGWRFGSGKEHELADSFMGWYPHYRRETEYEKKNEPKKNFDDRLQSRYSSFEQYGEGLNTKGLGASSQETANLLLQEQIKNLAENGQLLKQISENTKGMKGAAPLFG
jgi:hypothetical protein